MPLVETDLDARYRLAAELERDADDDYARAEMLFKDAEVKRMTAYLLRGEEAPLSGNYDPNPPVYEGEDNG